MARNDSGSDSDSDSDWNEELINAVRKKQGKSETINEEDRIKRIQECLDEGANVDTVDKHNNTALHLAAKKCYVKVIRFLIKKRARTDILNRYGQTVLNLAEGPGKEDVLGALKGSLADHGNPRASTSRNDILPDNQVLVKDDGQILKRKNSNGNEKDGNDKRRKLCTARIDVEEQEMEEISFGEDSEDEEIVSQRISRFDRSEKYAASGLKQTLHGNIYQLKLLMLFLKRGLRKGYAFRLATEMDAAEKFDDLVFQYENNTGNETIYRFLQAKHKQDENKTISVRDLLTETDGEFSLQKYFISFCKIRNHPELSKSSFKDFILCTNIDFDFDGLKSANICLKEVNDSDDFLNIESSAKTTARYKFIVKEPSELYEILKRTAAGYTLAKILLEHFYKSKDITLRNDIFKLYHTALAEEVIDLKTKKFSIKFIIGGQNLSDRGKKFREIFYAEALKQKKLPDTNISQNTLWQEIKNKPLKLSASFGQSDSKTILELPIDEVDDKDIKEFFEKLIFAVNQPNEIELGDVITSEIAADSQFNLLNADLVGDSFQKKMLEWFKEKGKEKGKEGRFFSAEDGRAFFDSAEQKVNALVSSGLSLSYPEELKEYGVEFEDENKVLRDFLVPDSDPGKKKALNINATGETLPTVIRVHRAIRKTERYTKEDSLLFLRLSTLRLPGIQKRVISAFESLENHHLLVIDCESEEKLGLQGLYKRLHRIMRNNISKKLILVTRVNELSSRIRFSNCSEAYDNVSFNCLTTESRYKLMEKLLINFQGEPGSTSFVKLLGIRGCENFGNVIDTETLVKLLRNEEIKVGSNLRELGGIEKYYIHRAFNRHVVINNDVLKSQSESDQFVISKADKGALTNLIVNGEKIRSFDEIDPQEQRLNRFIILDDEREAEQFEILCKKPFVNVHWLKREWGELTWEKSRGDIATLVAHRDVNERLVSTSHGIFRTTFISLREDQLIDHDEGQKVVIISDNAGMGKTTVFTYLAKKIKEKKPGLWVIRIDLNDFTGVLDDELKKPSFDATDTNGAVEFLVEKFANLRTDLEKKVLKTMIHNRGEVALLFDGFDEISPEYKNTVIDLLQAFAKIGLSKLLVATRPHMRGVLEDKLGVFSYTMEPFSEENQTEFLVRFWRTGLGLKNVEQRIEDRLKTYAEALTKKMVNSIGDWVKEFAGIPLQTQMMAEIFQDEREGNVVKGDLEVCEEFLYSLRDEPNLPGEIRILDLYRRFVDKKFYRYRTEKKKDDPTNLGVKDDSESLHEIFLKRHRNLALHTLFKNTGLSNFLSTPILPILLDQQEIKSINSYVDKIIEGKERTGIITQVIYGRAQFIHRTFAEYFSANFLINTLKQADHNPQIREFIVKQILDKSDYKVIRVFLNSLLPEQSLSSESEHEHDVVDPSAAESWILILQEHRDLFGDTIFHRAATEGNYEIVKFLLNRLGKDDETRKSLINAKNRSGDTILHVMANQQHWNELKWLVENEGVDINSSNVKGRSALHIAAFQGDLHMVEWLVGHGALPNALTNDGRTPLYEAAHSGRLSVVKWLIEKTKIDVDSRNKYGMTVLHIAASIGQSEIVKWLVKVKNANLNAKINDGKTVLHQAADKGQWEMVKWLILEGKVDVNCKGNQDETILSTAVSSGDLDLVKWLVENGADFNAKTVRDKTILHVAVSEREWTIFKWLVEQGADVNAKTWIGNTVLHEIAAMKKWDIVKWLIEKNSAAGTQDLTVLHNAARGKEWDLVKWLLEGRNVDINTYAYGEGTLVCHAASQERWEIVKWLLEEKNADVNSRSSEGQSLLSLTALKNNWDFVNWLILNNAADVDRRDYDGKCLIHHAASSGQFELIQWLVENRGSDINLAANDGKTVLHCAAASGVMPLVKWLVEEQDADIEAKSSRNKTAMHEAASREHWELVKWFFQKKSSILQVEDIDGATVVHIAARFRQWELVRLLVNSSNVDVNAATRHGDTVLRYIVESGHFDTIEWLIESKEIDVNAKFRYEKTILHYAVRSGDLRVVQWLVDVKGADINAADRNGKTILHEAAAAGRCEIFKWIADKPAIDFKALDEEERTVLHEAAVAGRLDMIRLIVESYNADVSTRDNYFATALDLYWKNRRVRNEAIVQLLSRGHPGLRPRSIGKNRRRDHSPEERLRSPRNWRREETVRLRKLSRRGRRWN